MEKNIKDYLHLYLDCDVLIEKETYTLTTSLLNKIYVHWENESNETHWEPMIIKPILQHLSCLTGEQINEIAKLRRSIDDKDGTNYWWGKQKNAIETKYLLSKHFDLFGLIEAGSAIDKINLL